MADPKNIRILTADAALRDQPFIDIINAELIIAIDAATVAETEYRIEYDINAALVGTDGPLQITRIQNSIMKGLHKLGYRAAMGTPVATEVLIVTWVIAELTIATP